MAMSTRSRTGATPPAARMTGATRATPPTPATPPAARMSISKKRNVRYSSSRSTASSASSSGLKVLPDLTLNCDDGVPRAIHSLFTESTPGLVLFTYPRANTGGCTAQATGLSALVDTASEQGYAIVGASYDSVKSQAGWKAKASLKCTLLSDTLDVGLLKKLGAHKAPKSVKRSVFIIRKGAAGSPPDDPIIVESRVPISPKDCITFVDKYIADNPCKNASKPEASGNGEDKSKDEEKSSAEKTDSQAPAASTPAKMPSPETDDAQKESVSEADKPEDKMEDATKDN